MICTLFSSYFHKEWDENIRIENPSPGETHEEKNLTTDKIWTSNVGFREIQMSNVRDYEDQRDLRVRQLFQCHKLSFWPFTLRIKALGY